MWAVKRILLQIPRCLSTTVSSLRLALCLVCLVEERGSRARKEREERKRVCLILGVPRQGQALPQSSAKPEPDKKQSGLRTQRARSSGGK